MIVAGGLRLGTVTATGTGTAPTPGEGESWAAYTSVPVWSVACPGLPSINVTLAVKEAVSPVGVVLFLSGGDGDDWWSNEEQTPEELVIDDLVTSGYTCIQSKWAAPGWFDSGSVNRVGPVVMAARPATLIRGVHAAYCSSVDLWVVGHSGGAAAAAYALTWYGLDGLVRDVSLCSGPPFAGIATTGAGGFGEDPADTLAAANKYDRCYGYAGDDTGPCATATGSATDIARWNRDSLDNAARAFPLATNIYVQNGEADLTGAVESSELFVAMARDYGQVVSVEVIESQSHGNNPNADGCVSLVGHIRDDPTALVLGDGVGETEAGTLTFTYATDLSRVPAAGNLLVMAVRASCAAADVTTPTGWTRDISSDRAVTGGTLSLCVFSRVVQAADTAVSVVAPGGTAVHGVVYEVHGLTAKAVNVSAVNNALDVTALTPVTAPTTGVPSLSPGWTCVAVASSVLSRAGRYGDGFAEVATGNRVQSAYRSWGNAVAFGPEFTMKTTTQTVAATVVYT